MFCHFRNAMRLALAALEACLREERWDPWKRRGRGLQMSRRTGVGYRLQVKWGKGDWRGGEYSRTPNTCQILGSENIPLEACRSGDVLIMLLLRQEIWKRSMWDYLCLVRVICLLQTNSRIPPHYRPTSSLNKSTTASCAVGAHCQLTILSWWLRIFQWAMTLCIVVILWSWTRVSSSKLELAKQRKRLRRILRGTKVSVFSWYESSKNCVNTTSACKKIILLSKFIISSSARSIHDIVQLYLA